MHMNGYSDSATHKKKLQSFRDAYCHHKMRTENRATPLQLWTGGMLLRDEDTLDSFEESTDIRDIRICTCAYIHCVVVSFFSNKKQHCLVLTGMVLLHDDEERVVVPDTPCPLLSHELSL